MLTATDKETCPKDSRQENAQLPEGFTADRMAWLMANMSELAYLKFDKPDLSEEVTLQLVERALKRVRKGTATRIIGRDSKALWIRS